MTGCSRRVHSGLVGVAGLGAGSVGTVGFWDSITGNGSVMKQRIRPGTAREATSRGNTVMVTEADLSSSCQGGPLECTCGRDEKKRDI